MTSMAGTGNGHTSGNGAGTAPGGGGKPGESIFKAAPPEGHAKKVSEVLGEVVWLMSQSALHKQFFITDLEWPACAARNTEEPMTPVLLQQFRMFYADDRPVGVLLRAFVSDEVEARLAQGITKLRPQDWKSGDKLWIVEAIAPFGGAEEMVKDLKAKVLAGRELRYLALGEGGRKDVRVV